MSRSKSRERYGRRGKRATQTRDVDGPAAALESEATPRGHSEQFIIKRGPDSITYDNEIEMQRGGTEERKEEQSIFKPQQHHPSCLLLPW